MHLNILFVLGLALTSAESASADVLTIPFSFNVTHVEGPVDLYFGRMFEVGDTIGGRISFDKAQYRDIDPRPIQGLYEPLHSRVEFDVPSRLRLEDETLRHVRLSVQNNNPSHEDLIDFNAEPGTVRGSVIDFVWVDRATDVLSNDAPPLDASLFARFPVTHFGLSASLDVGDDRHQVFVLATGSSAAAITPEPTSFVLMGTAVVALATTRRRRPMRRAGIVRTLAAVVMFSGLVTTRAAADQIVIPLTGGTVTVERNPIQPTAQIILAGPVGFVLGAGGVSLVPGGCDPCFGGDQSGLPGFVSAHLGQVTYGQSDGEFDLFVGGGGELSFTAPLFNLPQRSTEPIVFRTPFTMDGHIFLAPEPLGGTLADASFSLFGSGTAAATFIPGAIAGPGQEFFFESAVFTFSDSAAPTPEPATWLLLATGAIAARVRNRVQRCP